MPAKMVAVPGATRGDAGSAAAVTCAPDRASTPLPEGFGLRIDPAASTFDGGRVVIGGSPLRLLRLSARALELASAWESGATVGPARSEQVLARRLVSSGAFVPKPGPGTFHASDVTVVIPVRDRPGQLRRLLGALGGLSCIVVDDASTDAALTEEIATGAGASFLGLAVNKGPSSARNRGLVAATTPLVAFVDSDCIPPEGWLAELLGYFDDPLVAAVAPRIVPSPTATDGALARYEAARSPLDMGAAEGLVRPRGRIPYVPSAAVVVRRAVAGAGPLFDPGLRGGEDVDLVWRLCGAGWDVRYVPRCAVAHEGPSRIGPWLGRRVFYGTTAGPLAPRHGASLAPAEASAWSAVAWGLLGARRPLAAVATVATSITVLARRLDRLVDRPATVAAIIAGGGTAKAFFPAWRGLARAWAPGLVVGLACRATRRRAVVALVVPAVTDWLTRPGGLDPVRYAALHVADDVAYGTGVWAGCLKARTLRPLVPRLGFRSRTWSPTSLRADLDAPSDDGTVWRRRRRAPSGA